MDNVKDKYSIKSKFCLFSFSKTETTSNMRSLYPPGTIYFLVNRPTEKLTITLTDQKDHFS